MSSSYNQDLEIPCTVTLFFFALTVNSCSVNRSLEKGTLCHEAPEPWDQQCRVRPGTNTMELPYSAPPSWGWEASERENSHLCARLKLKPHLLRSS